jgi:hypothetical protein
MLLTRTVQNPTRHCEAFWSLHLWMYGIYKNNFNTSVMWSGTGIWTLDTQSGKKPSLEECRKVVLRVETYHSATVGCIEVCQPATVQAVLRCVSLPQYRLYWVVSLRHSTGCIEVCQPATVQAVLRCISLPQYRLYRAVSLRHSKAVLRCVSLPQYRLYWGVSLCNSTGCIEVCQPAKVQAVLRCVSLPQYRLQWAVSLCHSTGCI